MSIWMLYFPQLKFGSTRIKEPACAEASAVQAHLKQGFPLAPGMEIGYVIRDARKWETDPERTASEFDAGYYRRLLEKAWGELASVFD